MGASRIGDRRALALSGLAAWAIAVPWLARGAGLELRVEARLEVIDHVVPGLIVLVCCAADLHPRSGGPPGSLRQLALIGTAALAGFWITVTHAPLVGEALDGVADWGPALLHLSAGPPVTVVALWMLLADAGR